MELGKDILKEIDNEITEIIDTIGEDGLKDMLVDVIMEGAKEAIGESGEYGYMLEVAERNGLWDADVVSLIMLSCLPLTEESAKKYMNEAVVNKDGSPVELTENQLRYIQVLSEDKEIDKYLDIRMAKKFGLKV